MAREHVTPRRAILGNAVRALRKHLGMTQAGFARVLDVDVGTVSRWEREDLAPTAPKCRKLEKIARKEKLNDLAEVFTEPMKNWKKFMARGEPKLELAVLVEIIFMNDHVFQADDDEGQRLCWELERLVHRVADRLFERARAGEEISLYDEAQKTAWLSVWERHGVAAPKVVTDAQIKKARARYLELLPKVQGILKSLEKPDVETTR